MKMYSDEQVYEKIGIFYFREPLAVNSNKWVHSLPGCVSICKDNTELLDNDIVVYCFTRDKKNNRKLCELARKEYKECIVYFHASGNDSLVIDGSEIDSCNLW